MLELEYNSYTLGTSLLQYSLDQENSEWATIVSLIDHPQTKI